MFGYRFVQSQQDSIDTTAPGPYTQRQSDNVPPIPDPAMAATARNRPVTPIEPPGPRL